MICRHQFQLRKRESVAEASASDGEGAGGSSAGEDPDAAGEEVHEALAGRRDEGAAAPTEMLRDPRPVAGALGEPAAQGEDWQEAGMEERLGAAGPAATAADRVLGAALPADGRRRGVVFNPVDYDYCGDPCNVHWSASTRFENERKCQKRLMERPGARPVDDDDAVSREDLDPMQRFVYDLVVKEGKLEHDQRGVNPLRLWLHGSAGAGKTRTIRACVGARRRRRAASPGTGNRRAPSRAPAGPAPRTWRGRTRATPRGPGSTSQDPPEAPKARARSCAGRAT